MTTHNGHTIIDVRTIVPHDPPTVISRIFTGFRELPAGGALELVNDHDPRPVYHMLEARLPEGFTWEYLEEGPLLWRVRIGKPDASQRG